MAGIVASLPAHGKCGAGTGCRRPEWISGASSNPAGKMGPLPICGEGHALPRLPEKPATDVAPTVELRCCRSDVSRDGSCMKPRVRQLGERAPGAWRAGHASLPLAWGEAEGLHPHHAIQAPNMVEASPIAVCALSLARAGTSTTEARGLTRSARSRASPRSRTATDDCPSFRATPAPAPAASFLRRAPPSASASATTWSNPAAKARPSRPYPVQASSAAAGPKNS